MSEIKTDLNERERTRYAAACRSLQDQAGKLAEALDGGNDTKIVVEFMILGIVSSSLNELQKILLAAAKRGAPADSSAFLTPDESASRL